MNLRDFMSFRRMITPVIIQVLFWIGVAISVLMGVIIFFGGIIGGISDNSFGSVLGGLIGGPIIMLVGILLTRIYSELLILAFRINETLTEIKNLLERS